MSLSRRFIPKNIFDVRILNRVGLSWGGDGGGAEGQGARAGDIYIECICIFDCHICKIRALPREAKRYNAHMLCPFIALFNLFFWGAEAHLVFRFRFEDSVSPS